MDDGGIAGSAAIHPNTRSPDDVFRDYRGRRAGIVKALTNGLSLSRRVDFGVGLVADGFVCWLVSWCTDVEKFYKQCDPGEPPDLLLMLNILGVIII